MLYFQIVGHLCIFNVSFICNKLFIFSGIKQCWEFGCFDSGHSYCKFEQGQQINIILLNFILKCKRFVMMKLVINYEGHITLHYHYSIRHLHLK